MESASAPFCAQRKKEDEREVESSKSWSEIAPKNERRKNSSRVGKVSKKAPKSLSGGWVLELRGVLGGSWAPSWPQEVAKSGLGSQKRDAEGMSGAIWGAKGGTTSSGTGSPEAPLGSGRTAGEG